MYYEGYGVPKDYAEAAKWTRKAADFGLFEAQFNLGLMYFNGRGVPEDYVEAAKWMRKAAEQGSASAQYLLGLDYATGDGVPKDTVTAYMWTNLAAVSKEEAKPIRSDLEKSMTTEQVAEGQRLTREWLRTHLHNAPDKIDHAPDIQDKEVAASPGLTQAPVQPNSRVPGPA